MTNSLPPRRNPSNPIDAPKMMKTSENPETNASACRNGDGPATAAGGRLPLAIEAAPGPPPPAPRARGSPSDSPYAHTSMIDSPPSPPQPSLVDAIGALRYIGEHPAGGYALVERDR